MNGTVAPSAMSFTTAAIPAGGTPSSATRTGRGSNGEGGVGAPVPGFDMELTTRRLRREEALAEHGPTDRAEHQAGAGSSAREDECTQAEEGSARPGELTRREGTHHGSSSRSEGQSGTGSSLTTSRMSSRSAVTS